MCITIFDIFSLQTVSFAIFVEDFFHFCVYLFLLFALGRYKVDEVVQEEREDCYLATLHIKDASATDSRAYYLAVENDRGTDRHAVQLYVNGKFANSHLGSS